LKQVIAITGGTGFIGHAICRQLLAQGYTLRLLVRDAGKLRADTVPAAQIVHGDLDNQDSLNRLLQGADAVIHCAGRVRGASQAQFDATNVEGTRNLLYAVKAAGHRTRLLLFSSLAAREPQLSYYAASKRQAEKVLAEQGAGIRWNILRPPAVYGPGDRELLPLFRLMARGVALTAGSPKARFSMLYVEDLGAAAVAWLESNPAAGKTYALDDGQANGYDWLDISRVVGALCGRKVHVVQASPWLLDLAAWINVRRASVTGGSPMLSPQKLRELRHRDWVCNNADFRRDVDWQPQFRLAQGLREMPDWGGYRPAENRA